MSKYKFTIMFAVLFTIPLLGYVVVNGYLWLYLGQSVDFDRMVYTFAIGTMSLLFNLYINAMERGAL